MKPFELARDVLPVARFKAHASELIHRLRVDGRPVVITVNGAPAAVLISPAEYDRQRQADETRAAIELGLADVEAGRVVSDAELGKWADKRFGRKPRRR